MKSFFQELNNTLVGGITVVVTLITGVLFWVFEPDTLVPLYVVVIIVIGAYLIILLVYAKLKQPKEEIYRLPCVRKIVKREDDIIFIVEKNDLYAYNSLVSIYYESDIQEYLGVGYVETTNSKGYMQIKFYLIEDNQKLMVSRLKDDTKTRSAIKIKPSIKLEVLGGNKW